MGYTEHSEDDLLEIKFGIIKVYTLRGINFDKECQKKKTEVIYFGANCTLVISQSLNEASNLLTGDDFIEGNEEDWITEKKAKPPFVLIYFKETKARTLKGGYRQNKDDNILVYDAFPEGKKEIIEWEKTSLPSIITSLTVHFSTLERQVKLLPIEKSIFGTTKEGKTVFDLKISGKAEAYVSSSRTINDMALSLERSKKLFMDLNEKSSRHIYSALSETDNFKQFLSYFLFIERFTHSQYKNINKNLDVSFLFNLPDRVNESGNKFFKASQLEAKNLSQRFNWCALLIWKNLDSQDIDDFKEVKLLRDKISHGEDVNEKTLPVQKIKTLALKLLGTN